ncbi:MAG: hypothetical protein EAX89_02970 [Candidatus Lokiarchaeota archaeon]|nr:hypothetical protein [Candidatus Lokiarchaeota archaeon]
MNNTIKSKKHSKYILDVSQQRLLVKKIYPFLTVGSLFWLIGEIFFSNIFTDFELINQLYPVYIFSIILEAVLFVLFFIFSKKNMIFCGIITFYSFSFLAGILSLPIVLFTDFLPQIHMFVFLSLIANLIVVFISFVLNKKYFKKGYVWSHIILFLFGCTMGELSFVFIFNIQNYLLSVPLSLAYIIIIALVLMFWGSKAVKKSDQNNWIYISFKILSIVLIALLLALAIVILTLLLVILAIICGDSNIDFSGFTWSGTGRRKTKLKKKNNQII